MKSILLIIATFLLCSFTAEEINTDYRMETSDFIKRTIYKYYKTAGTNINEEGGHGAVNKKYDGKENTQWFIEEQREGGNVIVVGVAYNDKEIIDRGIKILRWGFKMQKDDGSFDCKDAYHSTAFFLSHAAHGVLILKMSPLAKDYEKEIAELTEKIKKSAQWMVSVQDQYMFECQKFVHRYYLRASAIGMAGALANDKTLLKNAWYFIEEGLTKQSEAGYNPEKGGYDSHYHSFGFNYAFRYYDLAATAEQKKKMDPMLKKGMAWLETRILPNGNMDTTGNTRTSGQEKLRSGKIKGVDLREPARNFYRWYLFTNDEKYLKLSETIFTFYDNLPKP